ncbi:RES family NAD+ phosphorylase [Rhizobium sp. TH2]|uniref:RES family NAD+ phosphorylase n=1 Tax=Rhizobium sp. TH2 TaxID=2775403 RepID=UPI002157CDA9|nr:RES family NAD+ phosphorylase [Rhizobium sp. TH2]UVC09392.1 RES family NAD+ phosphorylase [Rhizobium sp. TH2]
MDVTALPVSQIEWRGAVRVIRSLFPPIDLFEDIADPADWPLLIAAEQKTNPRLMESIGSLDLVPPARRVSGPGSSYLMAPFTHATPDRPSRFSNGTFGILYVADAFETALFETIHHHALFMARTSERRGWTSQFREILMDVEAELHDIRGDDAFSAVLNPADYFESQALGQRLKDSDSQGIVYPSIRREGGECVALFYPDLAGNARQGRHLDYHWDGGRVDMVRDAGSGAVYRVV